MDMISEGRIDEAVKALFRDIRFTEKPSGLYDPLRYMIEIGGKRLRPRLCLLTYGLYKDEFDESILSPAAGLEVFHSFTLIHDDIMDKSPLRRGCETVWKKWSDDTAVLSGDAMCIDSYRRIAKAPADVLPQVLDLFSTTAAQVCEGQQMDMDFETEEHVPMDDYMAMIGLKTGVLIACAAKMGAVIAGASKEDCDNLYRYGYSLGLAFQVADDYLDAFGDESTFGKPIGGDIVNNKKCWLTTRAIEKAEGRSGKILEAMKMPVGTEEEKQAKIQTFKGFYNDLGVSGDALEEIRRLTEEGLSYAAKVCSGERYEALRRFAEKLIGRKR
jgi:geranylgeranyl diphosphate synthase type II